MVPFGPFAAFIKECITFDVSGRNGGQLTRRGIANPQGIKVFAVEIYRLPGDLLYFRALCGVQSSPLVFSPNRAFVCGPLQRQAQRETLCYMSTLS